ncbi:MAG UNVERIFIED_CONTAM: hypothetical protein LVR18_04240 [Planctomycetaceae bacterium]
MEANFSLYWGLALMMYQSTLVSDEAPIDHFARGNDQALSPQAKEGMKIFLGAGRCINCHGGPEFAGATVSKLRGGLGEGGLIEFMPMEKGTAYYDGGFYNIGVRPTQEDIGLGANHPKFGPLSYSRQEQIGRNPDPTKSIRPDARITVDGAFKTPTLRNIELTGPYMHNGGMKSLEEVVQFYTRGADFFHANLNDLDPDVNGISELQGNPAGVAAVVEFMLHLTDPRVKYQAAPFDHPEIFLPNGHEMPVASVAPDKLLRLPETGAAGGKPLHSFEHALEHGLMLGDHADGYHQPVVEEPVVEEPVVEEPTVEEPAVEEPAVEEPADEEPAVEEPAVDEPAVDEPAVDEPAVEEPAVDEPAVDEPAVEEPAVEEPAVEEPAVEEPAVDEPDVEEPAVEEPAVDEPAVEEPAVEEPAVEEPAVEEPAVEEPAVEEPAVEEPAVEEPAVEEPADEEPAVEEPTVEEPAVDKPAVDKPAVEEPAAKEEETPKAADKKAADKKAKAEKSAGDSSVTEESKVETGGRGQTSKDQKSTDRQTIQKRTPPNRNRDIDEQFPDSEPLENLPPNEPTGRRFTATTCFRFRTVVNGFRPRCLM